MGDRAIIQLRSGSYAAKAEFSPCLYLHWHGSVAGDLIRDWWEFMRGRLHGSYRLGDVQYGFARLVGLAHNLNPDSNLSMGVWNSTTEHTDSHGDFGIALIDVEEETIKLHGGYGFSQSIEYGRRQNGTWPIPEIFSQFRYVEIA
jgi:hypothetical protein